MSDADGELTVAQRLGLALDRGLLPAGGPAEAAERLIERLERPARVALLGLPGSGKSSVLNLLLGSIVVPETLRLPTIVVQHGDVARMICTLTDGTAEIVPGSDLSQVLVYAPAMVTLEMDLPALKVISLLEVSAGPMEAEQRRATNWASKRADVVIWCSTSYLPKEQAVWESLPDAVKDNSFMFLTKVDLLGSRQSASAMHDRVEQRAGEEFRQILSISTKQARAAMPAGGPVNREMFRESGASAVITAIKTRVQSGRRADTDTAELLLARHVEASELVARRFAESDEPFEAPIDQAPLIEPEVAEPADVTPVIDPELIAESEPERRPEPDLSPEAEVEAEVDPDNTTVLEVADDPEITLTEAEEESIVSEPESGARRRFADRIKRVAGASDAATAPPMPLRSTWKSKADTDPPPEPALAAPKPTRRSPVTPSTVQEDGGDVARMLANVAAAPEQTVEPSVRTPRSVAPASTPTAEAPNSPDPQPPTAEMPLGGPDKIETITEPKAEVPKLEPEQGSKIAASTSVSVASQDLADGAKTTERPRLFGRDAGARPTQTRPDPAPPPATPGPRLPAPPRMRATPAALPPASPAPVDESQFTPRAIMMREPRAGAEVSAPRRERPRIAARAVAAPAGPTASVPVASSDLALVEEAIAVIVSRSATLEQQIDPEARVPVDLVLDHSRETTEQVMAILSRGRTGEMRRINSDLGEVLDLITLMQLEKGHAPADDALTLLLQLRRELETLLAA